MGKNSVVLEKKMSTAEVVLFLENIKSSLKEGKIVLQQGSQYVALRPGNSITLELKAGQKKDKGKLSIGLEWLLQEEVQSEADIIVSSVEPEPEPEPEPKPESKPESKKKSEPKKKTRVTVKKKGKAVSANSRKKAKPKAKK